MKPNFCPFCNIKLKPINPIIMYSEYTYLKSYKCQDHFSSSQYHDKSFSLILTIGKYYLSTSTDKKEFNISIDKKLVAKISIEDFNVLLESNQIDALKFKLDTLTNFQ